VVFNLGHVAVYNKMHVENYVIFCDDLNETQSTTNRRLWYLHRKDELEGWVFCRSPNPLVTRQSTQDAAYSLG